MLKREGGETREKRTKEGTGKFDKIHSDSLKKMPTQTIPAFKNNLIFKQTPRILQEML